MLRFSACYCWYLLPGAKVLLDRNLGCPGAVASGAGYLQVRNTTVVLVRTPPYSFCYRPLHLIW